MSNTNTFYNIYLNVSGLDPQSKYTLTFDEINLIVSAINSNSDTIFVDGRLFTLRPLKTVTIFDFSNGQVELKNKGYVKNEMTRIKRILRSGEISLYQHFGIDVTSEFRLSPNISTEKKEIPMQN